MNCSNCGFRIDGMNESQPVCPACGAPPCSAGPDDFERIEFETLEGINDTGEDLDDAEEDDDLEVRIPAQWVN
jgi:hypothetical protein